MTTSLSEFQKKWQEGNSYYKQFKDQNSDFRPRLIKARQAKEQGSFTNSRFEGD